jgi:glucose/mannose transport system permease protein
MIQSRKDMTKAFFVVLPSIVLVLIFVYLFIGWSLRVSLSQWDSAAPDFTFVGLKNYISIFSNTRFQYDLWNTLYFTILFLAITILAGLALALILERNIIGRGIFRNVFMFPLAISFVVTGVVWRWIFSPTVGVNSLLSAIGMKSLAWGWFTDPSRFLGFRPALIPVVIAASWQFSGYTMAVFIAGLNGIPREMIEASQIDGASGYQTFQYVKLPMLRPIILSAVIFLGHISLKIFDLVYTMTGAGPGFATDMPGIYMFDTTFRGSHYGEGSAVSIVMFLMIAVLIVPYLISTFRKEA